MIIFEKLRWKNILSTGNSFTELNLTKSPNTLVIGNNGAGKSTMLDALCFGLFGKPFRKINKPNLLNSINQQQGVVEVEFSIGQKKYKIIRGIKPNTFEVYCNNQLVDQDAKAKDYQDHLEKFILKINYKSFTQVVILGSASFVPFMQLSPGDRRAIIEDLLDIQIFSSMNGIVKDKMAVIKDGTLKNKYAMDLASEKILLQKQNIEEHKKHNQSEIEKKKKDVADSVDQIFTLQKDIGLIQKHIDVLQSKIADKLAVEAKSSKLLQLESKLESRIKKIDKEVSFYEQNDNCPTCKQGIEESFRQEQVVTLGSTKLEVDKGLTELSVQIATTNKRFEDIQNSLKHITAHSNEIVKHNSTVSAINQYVTKMQKEIEELSNRKDNLEEENTKLVELKAELSALIKHQEGLSVEKQYLEFAGNLLKDSGIKTTSVEIKSGINNGVNILQQGAGNHIASINNLNGSGNNINIDQNGSGNHEFRVLNSIGSVNSGNTITSTQSSASSQVFNLTLDGSTGATVGVSQTGAIPNIGSMTIQCAPGTCGTYTYTRRTRKIN